MEKLMRIKMKDESKRRLGGKSVFTIEIKQIPYPKAFFNLVLPSDSEENSYDGNY